MLEFQQVSLTYSGANQPALQQINLGLEPGRYLVVLGANGSGKTTLARLSNGLLLPSAGRVLVDGLDSVERGTIRQLRQLVGLVMQDPDEQIVSTTLADEVAFGPENLGLAPQRIEELVQSCLASVGLSDLAESDPNTLSGGQKQRLVLAGILAMQPRYLVLDEPTAMLDAAATAAFQKIIQAAQAAGSGILHITHDLELAAAADEVVVLAGGQLVFQGAPAVLLADAAQLAVWQLTSADPSPLVLSAARPESAPTPTGPLLRLREVGFSYGQPAGSREPTPEILTDISLTLAPGSLTLISGANGAGKSTLLRLAAGLLPPSHGSVDVLDSPSASAVNDASGQTVQPGQVGLVFQQPEDQLFAATVAEDICFGPRNIGLLPAGFALNDALDPNSVAGEVLYPALAAVGLDAATFAQRSPFSLSGGEMRRVAIAGVLAMRPRWLLLDEPTAGLDAPGRAFIHRLIAEQLAAGSAVVVVSHSVAEFSAAATSHYRLAEGRLWRQ
ncbi:MAG: ATP-binding cassette domain-containing protein [Actinomycetia bacterium]|nr:ATP-binding cassette domain-containing protein [Actinomycetes bacterium]